MKRILISFLLASALLTGTQNSSAKTSHDITSLSQWGPYSKKYFGISHIADLKSGIQVEFSLVTGQYRRNFKIPNALFEAGVHPWNSTCHSDSRNRRCMVERRQRRGYPAGDIPASETLLRLYDRSSIHQGKRSARDLEHIL